MKTEFWEYIGKVCSNGIFLTVHKLGKDAGVLTNYEIRPSSLVENERRQQYPLLAKYQVTKTKV